MPLPQTRPFGRAHIEAKVGGVGPCRSPNPDQDGTTLTVAGKELACLRVASAMLVSQHDDIKTFDNCSDRLSPVFDVGRKNELHNSPQGNIEIETCRQPER